MTPAVAMAGCECNPGVTNLTSVAGVYSGQPIVIYPSHQKHQFERSEKKLTKEWDGILRCTCDFCKPSPRVYSKLPMLGEWYIYYIYTYTTLSCIFIRRE